MVSDLINLYDIHSWFANGRHDSVKFRETKHRFNINEPVTTLHKNSPWCNFKKFVYFVEVNQFQTIWFENIPTSPTKVKSLLFLLSRLNQNADHIQILVVCNDKKKVPEILFHVKKCSLIPLRFVFDNTFGMNLVELNWLTIYCHLQCWIPPSRSNDFFPDFSYSLFKFCWILDAFGVISVTFFLEVHQLTFQYPKIKKNNRIPEKYVSTINKI